MKILLIGNIGSGKTTLGNQIQKITGYKFIQIDQLREKYLDGTVSSEYSTLFHFLRCIESNKDLILEFTGAGCHKYAVKRALELSNDNILIILCQTRNFLTIQERAKLKKFDFAQPFKIDLDKHVEFIKKELENDLTSQFWVSDKFHLFETFMDTLDDIEGNINFIKQGI